MQYIQLSNDSFILHTKKGATQVSRSNFNFTKIKNLISKGTDEESLLPLLEPPELPNGVYEAFEVPTLNKMYYKHTSNDNANFSSYYAEVGAGSANELTTKPAGGVFVGVYASLKDLHYDWPEYLL